MMCIILRGGHQKHGSNGWQGRRSVETVGYHHRDKEVRILFSLYLENKLKDEIDNSLFVLHPGKVEYNVIDPWPPPLHQDEPNPPKNKNGDNILSSVYGKAFKYDNQKLVQANGLSAWDSWYGWNNEPVSIWPKSEKNLGFADCVTERLPANDERDFVPFTVFKLGPFRKKGAYLTSFTLTARGETYDRLLRDDPIFTVDGPESLLLRIERDYISKLPSYEQQMWRNELSLFEEYIGLGESYDVILIKNPYADKVKRMWESGIVKAPLQPIPSSVAVRYITRNPGFSLGLKNLDDVRRQQKYYVAIRQRNASINAERQFP